MRPPVALKHGFPFDPAYGYDEAGLLAITAPAEVADFADFWRGTFAQTMATPLRLEVGEPIAGVAGRVVREVRFDTLGGVRVGAWWSMPTDGEIAVGCVTGHGYGGRGDWQNGWRPSRCAEILPCAPGFNLSARADLPDTSDRHVIHGIASRETYLIRACVASMWSAASALIELAPAAAGRLLYLGGSFAGGLGSLALPWDERFAAAFMEVPTFGHHPLRLTCRCVGSGESVRSYAADHPGVMDVLAYFDAAVAARRIAIPTLVCPARFDPAVPPPGQYAVANALPNKVMIALTTGHFDNPDGASDQRAQLRAWRSLAAARGQT
ncbi:MAG: acetylxylan esterase [Planctomycetes bacterium]|nr:acetylxylan esterase [Planctomycetota bacterium]